MNLRIVRPKNETEGFLFSIPKNCKTVNEQTHTRADEPLCFKLTQAKETFSFKPPTLTEGS